MSIRKRRAPPAEAAQGARARLPSSLLTGLYALSFVSVNIILPSIPAMAADFATSIAAVQGALSVYLVGLGLGQLFYGSVSDRLGRKPVLLVGLGVFVLGSAICCFATNIAVFLVGRLLQALGAAAGSVLGRAMIRDVYGQAGAASIIGYTVTATSIASGISPVLGTLIDGLAGWRADFGMLLILGTALLVACRSTLRETRPVNGRPPESGCGGWLIHLGSKTFLHNALFSSFLFGAWYGFVAGAPAVVMSAWGNSTASFALWWTAGSASYMLGSYAAGRYSRARSSRAMITAGSVMITTGASLMLLAALLDIRQPFALFGPMDLLLVGFGVAQPSAVASAINTHPDYIGATSGVMGSAQIFFALASISVIGLVSGSSDLPFVSICSGMGFAAVICYFAVAPRVRVQYPVGR